MSTPVVTLVPGFRIASVPGPDDRALYVLLGDGPSDAAAGVLRDDLAPGPRLWSTQVLSDGRLRAVVLGTAAGPTDGAAPVHGFDVVHAAAERAAHDHDLGAVDVAVLGADVPETDPPVVTRPLLGGSLAGLAVRAPGTASAHHRVLVLVTDALSDATTLGDVLSAAAVPGDVSVLLLAGGVSGATPAPDALAQAVREVCDDLCTPSISREPRS